MRRRSRVLGFLGEWERPVNQDHERRPGLRRRHTAFPDGAGDEPLPQMASQYRMAPARRLRRECRRISRCVDLCALDGTTTLGTTTTTSNPGTDAPPFELLAPRLSTEFEAVTLRDLGSTTPNSSLGRARMKKKAYALTGTGV